MREEEEFKWKDKWNKTKSEILEFLGHEHPVSMKLSKGTSNSLRLEQKGRRIEISSEVSKTILKEWTFYYDGGWKTTGYEEFFGISKEQDAVREAVIIFAAKSVDCDSYLVQYLEAQH